MSCGPFQLYTPILSVHSYKNGLRNRGEIIMAKNTGLALENEVYQVVSNLVKNNNFILANPYVKVHKKKGYYSKDRESNIIFDVTVEKYWEDPDTHPGIKPALIVVIECKDYAHSVPVDDVEEFHAKLQQIGADNTKGMMITRKGSFQPGALKYANSKNIGIARVLPHDQLDFLLHMLTVNSFSNIANPYADAHSIVNALTNRDYRSDNGQSFFSMTCESSLENMVKKLLQ